MNISSSMSAKAPIISKPPVAQTAPQDPPVIIPEDQYTSPSKVGPALIIGGAALAGGLLGYASGNFSGVASHATGAFLGTGIGAVGLGTAGALVLGSGSGDNAAWGGLAGLLYGGAAGAAIGAVAGGIIGSSGMGIAAIVGGVATGGVAGTVGYLRSIG